MRNRTTAARLGLCLGLLLALLWPGGGRADQMTRYRLQPGDRLQIQVLQDHGLDRTVLILPDGSFTFPYIGPLRAAGHSVTEVQRRLIERLAPNFTAPPDVYVSVIALAERPAAQGSKITVYAMGEVAHPGAAEIRPGTTLLQFLAQIGGLTPFAAARRIELQRTAATGRVEVLHLDLRRGAMASAATLRLEEGDVLVAPERRLFEFD